MMNNLLRLFDAVALPQQAVRLMHAMKQQERLCNMER